MGYQIYKAHKLVLWSSTRGYEENTCLNSLKPSDAYMRQ